MNLVNKEDYITCGLYRLNKRFHTAFKLTSELRACDKGGKVEHIKLLTLKSEGNIAVRQLLSYALCNSGSPIMQGLFFVRRDKICITR